MFWNSFIAICNDNNTTPTATVKALGISLGSVTKWKNGAQPNSTTLKKIADFFNVSIETLSGKKEKQPTPSELSEKQKRLIKIIEGMSDDQLDRFEKILAVVETTEL